MEPDPEKRLGASEDRSGFKALKESKWFAEGTGAGPFVWEDIEAGTMEAPLRTFLEPSSSPPPAFLEPSSSPPRASADPSLWNIHR